MIFSKGGASNGHEGLDLNEVESILRGVFREYGSGGLDFKYEYTDNRIDASCQLSLKNCDDHILAFITFYTDGSGRVSFYFDKLAINERNLKLVNQFNDNCYYLKACIDDKGFLVISCPAEYVNSETVGKTVERSLNELLKDRTQKYLFPLTVLTEGDD